MLGVVKWFDLCDVVFFLGFVFEVGCMLLYVGVFDVEVYWLEIFDFFVVE